MAERRILSDIFIEICDNQDKLEVDHERLQRTAEYVCREMKIRVAHVSIALVDDETIRELKRQYFGRAEATDVISFNLGETEADPLECEIVINTQKARREARQRNSDPAGEVNLYLVHGLLHQLGYDDQVESDAAVMHEMEDQMLTELGFGHVFGGND